MQHYLFSPVGVCSRQMDIYLDDDNQHIEKVVITGGCPGNTMGVSKLVAHRSIDEVIQLLSGIDCRNRGTSCPDQLAIALKKIKNHELQPSE